MLWQGTGEPEVGGKLGAVFSCGMVWPRQQDAALEKANTVQGCIRQGVFSADLTTVQGAARISLLRGLCLTLVPQQGEVECEEGGKGCCGLLRQTEPLA